MTRYAQDILFFMLVGLLIGVLMRQRENGSTPPPRGAKAQRPPMAPRSNQPFLAQVK
jgi:hypothetical protein